MKWPGWVERWRERRGYLRRLEDEVRRAERAIEDFNKEKRQTVERAKGEGKSAAEVKAAVAVFDEESAGLETSLYDDLDGAETELLLAKARDRLIYVPLGDEKWTARIGRRLGLTDYGAIEVQRLIREEKRTSRREFLATIGTVGGALVGIIGAVTGLVAVSCEDKKKPAQGGEE